MADACVRRTSCRLCGSHQLTLILKLAPTPPANAFVPKEALDKPQSVFPLDVAFCEGCGHVQLLDVVDPAVLFEDYVYVSGTSPVFVQHFQHYANALFDLGRPAGGDLVVDIGSNDGTLLRAFKDKGMEVQGIDPAKAIAERATADGIPTRAAFFGPDLGRAMAAELGPAAIVTANNVYAHIDDLGGVTDGVRALLAPDGLFSFEVSYLGDVFTDTLFDTIYHEHLSYHSVRPLIPFLAAHGLELIEAVRVPTHGGSLRGIAQRTGGPRRVGASVADMLAYEKKLGLEKAETFHAFAARIEERKRQLAGLLAERKAQGRRIVGYGAPAKATTLMYHFGLGRDALDYIVDDSPLKQGLYSPGLHVPVRPARALEENPPDDIVILAWNFAEPIMKKLQPYREAGIRFIVPLPEVKLY